MAKRDTVDNAYLGLGLTAITIGGTWLAGWGVVVASASPTEPRVFWIGWSYAAVGLCMSGLLLAIAVIAGVPARARRYREKRPWPLAGYSPTGNGRMALTLEHLYWIHGNSVHCEVVGPKGRATGGAQLATPRDRDAIALVCPSSNFNPVWEIPLVPGEYRIIWRAPTQDSQGENVELASCSFKIR
jgi:hypothetical protein